MPEPEPLYILVFWDGQARECTKHEDWYRPVLHSSISYHVNHPAIKQVKMKGQGDASHQGQG